MMPLTFAKENKEFVIKELRGRDRASLLEKGFCIGSKICLLTDNNNNYIVKINNSKYVVNFSLASKIIIDEQ